MGTNRTMYGSVSDHRENVTQTGSLGKSLKRGLTRVKRKEARMTTAQHSAPVTVKGQVQNIVKVTLNLPRALVEGVRSLALTRSVTMTDVIRQSIQTELFLDEARTKGEKVLLYNEKSG